MPLCTRHITCPCAPFSDFPCFPGQTLTVLICRGQVFGSLSLSWVCLIVFSSLNWDGGFGLVKYHCHHIVWQTPVINVIHLCTQGPVHLQEEMFPPPHPAPGNACFYPSAMLSVCKEVIVCREWYHSRLNAVLRKLYQILCAGLFLACFSSFLSCFLAVWRHGYLFHSGVTAARCSISVIQDFLWLWRF